MHSEVTEATAVATQHKLKNWRQLRRFFRFNGQVKRQIRSAPGLISFSQKADFLRLRFSTLSAWRGEPSVGAFARSGAHRGAMAVFDEIASREQSGFIRWKTTAPEALTWKEAGDRISKVLGTSLSSPDALSRRPD